MIHGDAAHLSEGFFGERADMRRRSTFGRAAKGMDEGGSCEKASSTAPLMWRAVAGAIEGAFINDAAPCHVDEHGGGLHEPEFAGTDKGFRSVG